MTLPKQINFRESSKGGGIFSIQKIMLQILDLKTGPFEHKICDKIFRKRGGGVSKAVWNFSENSSVLVAPSFPEGTIREHPGCHPSSDMTAGLSKCRQEPNWSVYLIESNSCKSFAKVPQPGLCKRRLG